MCAALWDGKLRPAHNYDKSFYEMVKTERSAFNFQEKYPQFVYRAKTIEDGYRDGSSIKKLPHITTPTLVLKSETDPVIGDATHDDIVLSNKHLLLATTKHGGHLGYYESLMSLR